MTQLVTPKIQNVIRFICNFRRFSSELASELKPLGLGADGCLILFLLHGETDQIMSRLAETLGMNLPTTTKLIDRLVADNLIHRKPNPSDRRVVNLLLTDIGEQKAVESFKVLNKFLIGFSKQYPDISKNVLRK